MIVFKNVMTVDGHTKDIEVIHEKSEIIDASGLTLLPGLIDPHVHFRVPGQEYKEDWMTASKAAIRGGYTMVFDMPNNKPPIVTHERLIQKIKTVESQLSEVKLPLRYGLYFGTDRAHFDQIGLAKDNVIALKVFMGSSTGGLLIDDISSLHAVFSLAAVHNLVVAVHAESEAMINERTKLYYDEADITTHSKVRSPEVAEEAVAVAIDLCRIYGVKLYILHVSSINELSHIMAAKEQGLPVYCETTPHHLFLNTDAYKTQGGKVKMNPPLRTAEHQEALFDAIERGVVDTVGTDHAPHTLDEKLQPGHCCPCGVPGIETSLPLMLNAVNEGKMSLHKVVSLTHYNILKLFDLPDMHDFTLVDMSLTKTVDSNELKTKCAWSPFEGMTLQGWPVYTVVNSQVFKLDELT